MRIPAHALCSMGKSNVDGGTGAINGLGLGFGIFLSASFTVVDPTFADLRLGLLEECDESRDAIMVPAGTLTVSELTFRLEGSDCDCTPIDN